MQSSTNLLSWFASNAWARVWVGAAFALWACVGAANTGAKKLPSAVLSTAYLKSMPPTPPQVIELPIQAAMVGVDAAKEAQDVWQLIRRGFAIPDLFMRDIAQNEREFLRNSRALVALLEKSEPYIHYIATECEKRGLPTELALVPFIESRFDPYATSHARAEGLWQIIPSTGKHFELKQNQWVDERRDVVASTRVALDYLTYLYDMFGDWHLALMAYNWGEGSILKAIKQAKAKGMEPNIGNLDLPTETRRYVPKLQAIKNIIQYPEKFGVTLPHLPNAPYFVAIRQKRNTDLRDVARSTGTDLEVLKALNAGLKQNRLMVAQTDLLLIPAQAQGKTASVPERPTITARTPEPIEQDELERKPARKEATPTAAKSRATQLSKAKVAGKNPTQVAAAGKAAGGKKRFASYEVKPGDTLAALANKFNLPKQELVALNGLGRKNLAPGMLISVPQ